ncbi:DUF4190 domain-containing protein [Streptomyces chumphonensis]|uniref:DUF4190 domain-containing protein n=1 Tax=Streptomyces chumphonensis TaxID=1214925 RepID=A0A927F1H1_9ACTN|nr:DUF4190 domain-containing protein [Streptomyces chumphonensis]MBD3932494.1 DUF4190 domain-containing protein [Streptomyces chumphonensis]
MLFGIIPLFFWLAAVLGIIALIMGVVGARRAKQRIATNGRMSVVGAVLGGLAIVLAIVGLVIVSNAFDDLERDLDDAVEPTPTASPSPGVEEPPPTEDATEEPIVEEALAFGDASSYPDGLEVAVSSPTPYTPSDTAAGHSPGNETVTVEVTVVNGTDERQDLGLVVVDAKDASGRTAEPVFDTGIEGLQGTLLPGDESVATYAFDLPPDAADELTIEVTPDFDHDSALWNGPTS